MKCFRIWLAEKILGHHGYVTTNELDAETVEFWKRVAEVEDWGTADA